MQHMLDHVPEKAPKDVQVYDLYQMEIDQHLAHWLSPLGKKQGKGLDRKEDPATAEKKLEAQRVLNQKIAKRAQRIERDKHRLRMGKKQPRAKL